MHEKAEGIPLSERFNLLNNTKRDKAAQDIANFYTCLHNVKISDKHPKILQLRTSEFLDELAKVDDNPYDYSFHDIMRSEEEKELVYVFGDLNIKNILLDENDDISYFLDYTFFGISNRYTDLARMNSLINREFLDRVLYYYEKMSGFRVEDDIFEKHLDCWNYVEGEYIKYIRCFQKDINLDMYAGV
jgi:aminoglycoside phosphotransferase (APT) family kinase protein